VSLVLKRWRASSYETAVIAGNRLTLLHLGLGRKRQSSPRLPRSRISYSNSGSGKRIAHVTSLPLPPDPQPKTAWAWSLFPCWVAAIR
jgi:hypothetical protein